MCLICDFGLLPPCEKESSHAGRYERTGLAHHWAMCHAIAGNWIARRALWQVMDKVVKYVYFGQSGDEERGRERERGRPSQEQSREEKNPEPFALLRNWLINEELFCSTPQLGKRSPNRFYIHTCLIPHSTHSTLAHLQFPDPPFELGQ